MEEIKGKSAMEGRVYKERNDAKEGDIKEERKDMAGLAMLDQKNVIAVTIIIVTAFKICISHRKNGLLNRPCTQVSFSTF